MKTDSRLSVTDTPCSTTDMRETIAPTRELESAVRLLSVMSMSLILRRVRWPDGHSPPDDYEVMHESRRVGRIYRMNSVAKETWWWGLYAEQRSRPRPWDGLADSLEEAKAAFKGAWERAR